MQGLVGVVALLLLAWLISEDRRNALAGAQRRLVIAGLLLLFGLALLLLKVPPVRDALLALNGVVNALDRATAAGTAFVFGFLGGAPAPMMLITWALTGDAPKAPMKAADTRAVPASSE